MVLIMASTDGFGLRWCEASDSCLWSKTARLESLVVRVFEKQDGMTP